MKKRTRSILEELNSLGRKHNNDRLIESSASNIIESSINLIQKIYETYDEQTAGDLERRFLNSIRAGSSKKFVTGVTKVIESKK